jgi:hypothetical protein
MEREPTKRRTPTTMIVAGIVSGLAWGLFFGESGAWVRWVGDAYVGLLQMTVLPFVALSLTSNAGRLTAGESGRLARASIGVLGPLWIVGLATMLVMSASFPRFDAGSFFSTCMVQQPERPDWLVAAEQDGRPPVAGRDLRHRGVHRGHHVAVAVHAGARVRAGLRHDGSAPDSVDPADGHRGPDSLLATRLVFIPFAAWFYGMSVEPMRYPQLVGVGFLGAFAKPVVTIPLLLNIAEIPSDIFNLYLSVGVVASRFGDMMKAMHLLAFSILTATALSGGLVLRTRGLLIRGAATLLLLGVTVLGTRAFLRQSFQDDYCKAHLIKARELLLPEAAAVVLEQAVGNPDPLQPGEDPMQRIHRRGVIRIGFKPIKLPVAYFNLEGRLVGNDRRPVARLRVRTAARVRGGRRSLPRVLVLHGQQRLEQPLDLPVPVAVVQYRDGGRRRRWPARVDVGDLKLFLERWG